MRSTGVRIIFTIRRASLTLELKQTVQRTFSTIVFKISTQTFTEQGFTFVHDCKNVMTVIMEIFYNLPEYPLCILGSLKEILILKYKT